MNRLFRIGMRRALVILAALCMSCIEFNTPLPIKPEAVRVIRGATRVESFRLDPVYVMTYDSGRRPPPAETHGRIGRHYVTEIGPVLSRDQARRASALLRDAKTYLRLKAGDSKACLPEYRHALVFSKGDRRIAVVICFDCADLGVADEDDHALGGGYFDPKARELRALMDELLPDPPPSEPK